MATQRPRNRKPDPSITLRISESDLAIFAFLQDHPGADQHLIAEALGYKKAVVVREDGRTEVRYWYLLKRLTKLRDADYIWWPPGSTNHANHRYRPACYANRPKAEAELRTHKRWRQGLALTNSFAHDYGCAYVPASFRIGARQDPRLRFINWAELLANEKCPAKTRDAAESFSIPLGITDGEGHMITKQHDGRPWGIGFTEPGAAELKMHFFLEFHRGTEPNGAGDYKRASAERHVDYTLRLMANDCALYRDRFGARFYVIFVCIAPGDVETIKKYILKHTNGVGHKRILLTHISDFMGYGDLPPAAGTMLTCQYERAGFPPLDLLELLGAKEKRAAA